jgi:integrase
MRDNSNGVKRKAVYAKKYFKFSKEAADSLMEKKQRTGKTETQVVEDAITGKDRFSPDVEAEISALMKRSGLPRDEDSGEIEIFSVEEISRLLAAARAEMVPFLAIGAFAGLRSAEIQRLDWSEIRGDFIHVAKGKAKTRSRRLVPIQPNLAQWLAPHRKESGPVVPLASIGKQIVWLCEDTAVEAKDGRAEVPAVKWKHNALRHSFISYRLAVIHDENRVASEAGNSPTMIHAHYRELVTPTDAAAWFAVSPKS